MKLIATLLSLPLVALALPTELGHAVVQPRIAAPAAGGILPIVTERGPIDLGDKCKYNPLSFDMYTCSPDKKTIYECHFQTSTWTVSSSCLGSSHCIEGSGFCVADPPATRNIRAEASERAPIKPGDKCKYDHLSFDMYSCSPDKQTIYECSPQTNKWQVSQTCPSGMHCIPQSGFCVSNGPAKNKPKRSPATGVPVHDSNGIVKKVGSRDEATIQATKVPVHDSNGIVKKVDKVTIQATGVPVHDSNGIVKNLDNFNAEKTYTLPRPQPTMKPRSHTVPVKEGDACHYDQLNSSSFSACGRNGRDVFHCNIDTSKWEFFWTCKGISHCENGGDFCVLGAPGSV